MSQLDSTAVMRVRLIEEDPYNLRITFPSGKTYGYLRVPLDVCAYFLAADSKGRAFNAVIRGEYEHRRLPRIDARTDAPALEDAPDA